MNSTDMLPDEVIDDLTSFLGTYYADELSELAQNYPNDQDWLEIDWSDLLRAEPDVADDYLEAPDIVSRSRLSDAIRSLTTS